METLLTGTLATRRRTVAGIIGQSELAGLNPVQTRGILRRAGLPAQAAEDTDFPVSVDREVTALSFVLQQLLATDVSLTEYSIAEFSQIGINHYGILGLAMQHAPTVQRSLMVLFAYPQLCWGHSRISVTADGERATLVFELDAPTSSEGASAAAQRDYLVVRDLISIDRQIRDVVGDEFAGREIDLPVASPRPDFDAQSYLDCPVRYDSLEAALHLPRAVLDLVPALAANLPFRRYDKIARLFAQLLHEEEDIAEQGQRLIWAYTPPPSREQLAAMLNISTRTLARRLRAQGTSYNKLLRTVQSQRAMNYLRETSLNVAEIADRLGYSEPAAFTRAFQGWTGVAPLAWRNADR